MESPEEKLKRQTIWYRRYKSRLGTPTLSEHHKAYLEEIGALLVLPKTTTDALLPLYISLLDDLIPVVDGSRVFRDLSNGEASTYLVRAMCLVICKTKQAAPFLRLTEDGPLLEHRKFGSKLLVGLDAALKADLEPDRVIKTQILALMHLHNDGFAGGNRSSSYLSQAICEAWSMSLHFNIAGNTDQEQCNFLWWSLRNFDRLNKPIMGAAPFIIDDTDISIDRISAKTNSYRSQIMEVSTMLGDLMTIATRVYKASSKSTVDDGGVFPTLEDITSNTNFPQFHQSHRVYLELWYHIAAMLSCRYSGPGAAQYDRRLASADRVFCIFSKGGHENFPPLPLVPYALSMSTTVIYRALRDGQRDLAAAYEDLQSCCDALDVLGQRWTSAKGVAKIAKRLCRISARASRNPLPQDTAQGAQNTRHIGGHVASRNPLNTVEQTPAEEAELMNMEPTLSSSLTGSEMVPGAQLSSRDQLWQGQALGPWPGGMDDPSCVPLDRAFYDLFDYSIPDVFRGPATCEFLQLVHNEDDGLDCGIQSTSPLASFSGCSDPAANMPF
ncbi:unnamed protein product [Clonostachys rosea]|uniref:Transcription factor domain-containing protein n=1 Tax=Bionectria ochroleuca TaxID=29856 RepID=A0ABY6UNK0_BIOOC|nr:unnamed protein product [Clonostachys rosea]